ncbi:MAG: putative nucleic acid-binding Zn-ribbon protein [Flavobacteriales bacterium]|jgi:predicted  nucleic acid-binding Zn-ribbon protein
MAKAKSAENPVAVKLEALYKLQKVDSEIDRIRTQRGELPLEVQDLEDDIAGLETRLEKLSEEVKETELHVTEKKNAIKDSEALIKKYQEQQEKVRNNREFDALSKELEFQGLEMQLCEKRIKEYKSTISDKKELVDESTAMLVDRKKDLEAKQGELSGIVSETEKDEKKLTVDSEKAQKVIEDRLLTAYHRIRGNALNGLAVVKVERDACGGCFNKIPPQRQLDIKSHKKVIVCEHCGRILVDFED